VPEGVYVGLVAGLAVMMLIAMAVVAEWGGLV
jgi:hypothetical protein